MTVQQFVSRAGTAAAPTLVVLITAIPASIIAIAAVPRLALAGVRRGRRLIDELLDPCG